MHPFNLNNEIHITCNNNYFILNINLNTFNKRPILPLSNYQNHGMINSKQQEEEN